MHSQLNLRQTLRSQPLFDNVTDSEFGLLYDQLKTGSIYNFAPGAVVFTKGKSADACYVVVEGELDIRVSGQPVGKCRAGQLLGELGLIGKADTREADAIALEPTTLLEIRSEQFEKLLSSKGTFALNVLKGLAQKLRWTTSDAAKAKSSGNRYSDILRRHVSPPVVDYLMRMNLGVKDPEILPYAIVLFADIQDYTKLTQDLADPVQLASELTQYFQQMTKLIHDHEGVVNAFLGDGILAFWGFPKLPENAVAQALDCAIQMRAQAGLFNLGSGPIVSRIGLAAGEVFCGIVGTPPVEQFTILGDVVNLAARLEQSNKETGTSILVTREAFGPTAEEMSGSLPDSFGEFVDVTVEAKGYTDAIDCLGLRYEAPGPLGSE